LVHRKWIYRISDTSGYYWKAIYPFLKCPFITMDISEIDISVSDTSVYLHRPMYLFPICSFITMDISEMDISVFRYLWLPPLTDIFISDMSEVNNGHIRNGNIRTDMSRPIDPFYSYKMDISEWTYQKWVYQNRTHFGYIDY
jgi:hypothetical protein